MLPFRIPTEQPVIADDQAATIRQFLNSAPGQLLLQSLFFQRPVPGPLPPGVQADPVRRALEADHLLGYERCIDRLIELATPTKTRQ